MEYFDSVKMQIHLTRRLDLFGLHCLLDFCLFWEMKVNNIGEGEKSKQNVMWTTWNSKKIG